MTSYENIRSSNVNCLGELNLICEKSGWAGFRSRFHSPRIAADGTSRATVLPALIHVSPKLRSDSPLLAYHLAGKSLRSSRAISRSSGTFPSIETKSISYFFPASGNSVIISLPMMLPTSCSTEKLGAALVTRDHRAFLNPSTSSLTHSSLRGPCFG